MLWLLRYAERGLAVAPTRRADVLHCNVTLKSPSGCGDPVAVSADECPDSDWLADYVVSNAVQVPVGPGSSTLGNTPPVDQMASSDTKDAAAAAPNDVKVIS